MLWGFFVAIYVHFKLTTNKTHTRHQSDDIVPYGERGAAVKDLSPLDSAVAALIEEKGGQLYIGGL